MDHRQARELIEVIKDIRDEIKHIRDYLGLSRVTKKPKGEEEKKYW